MPRISSTSGTAVRKAPGWCIGRQDTPSSTSSVDCAMLMTPRTSSLEIRYAPDDSPAARSRVRIERSLTSSRTELAMPARQAQMTMISSRVPASALVVWRARQALLGRHLGDQRAEEDGQQDHERQVAAVGRDHPHVAPGQRAQLAERAAPLRRRGGRQFLALLRLRRLRPLAQHVLGVGGRGGVLGGPVAVRVPLEGLEHLGPAGLAEVGEPFLGRAVVGDPPAGDQDEQPVAGVQVVHAVGDDDDRPAVVGQVPHLLHDRLVQARVQARGRLVQEQQRRLGQQLLRHVDPLELAAGQPVGAGVGVPGQAQLAHHLVDPAVAFGRLDVGGEPELGRVLQRAPRGQLGVQHALLRDQADPVPELVVVLVQVTVVVQHRAGGRGAHPGQRAEQGGLARAAGADDAEQALFRDRERSRGPAAPCCRP